MKGTHFGQHQSLCLFNWVRSKNTSQKGKIWKFHKWQVNLRSWKTWKGHGKVTEFEVLKSVLCVIKILKLPTLPSPDTNFLLTAKSWVRGGAWGAFPKLLSWNYNKKKILHKMKIKFLTNTVYFRRVLVQWNLMLPLKWWWVYHFNIQDKVKFDLFDWLIIMMMKESAVYMVIAYHCS